LARLIGALFLAATWLRSRRRTRASFADHARLDFKPQTRGRGLRLTEWLRDKLRPDWLRIRSAGDANDGPDE
jgi:hypothetical protein